MCSEWNPGNVCKRAGAKVPKPIKEKGPRTVARKSRAKEAGTAFIVTPKAGAPFRIVVSGRNRWALENLRRAGITGCTPITNPAPRWSHYIHQLRELGVQIETIPEPHGGAYPGTHGRYVLRCAVAPEWKGGA
ncbi:winged helix domain-containing protein [Pseudoprimorskyibacter insulae]|uniref:Winged helix domain-containing protein n=1 Tax=Pseudoprimorskyibacter insulae TaxID=1695997 RepID=A0A2R8AYP1_9RHOB|nr:hypothetical protein [Pseudoprimorskyibacter insulae]SPF81136.1 hypothetical protein PRI8871_02956 [Pseudoprimorskyibacter insulae]